jgi:KipI family sensor histidine kinase inhibitor
MTESSPAHPRLLDAGDGAFTIEFGDTITPEAVARVAALERALIAARERGELPGVVEAMPTFRSLTVMYDPLATSRTQLDPVVRGLLAQAAPPSMQAARRWRLPVCYGGEFGADLAHVAASRGLSTDEVVRLHAGSTFTVYMLGFMPGFPFMGGLPAALSMPRRTEPRVRVPAGSVAITGPLTAIYPWESPGGWQLLGRCPVPLFDAEADEPVLLAPGDEVRFEPVPAAEWERLQAALAGGELAAASFRERGA